MLASFELQFPASPAQRIALLPLTSSLFLLPGRSNPAPNGLLTCLLTDCPPPVIAPDRAGQRTVGFQRLETHAHGDVLQPNPSDEAQRLAGCRATRVASRESRVETRVETRCRRPESAVGGDGWIGHVLTGRPVMSVQPFWEMN